MKQFLVTLALFALAAFCQASEPQATVDNAASESYEQALQRAQAAIQTAAEKGHAWSTSDSLLEQAADAAESGDEANAIALADEARIHAELAIIQAESERSLWRSRVLSD